MGDKQASKQIDHDTETSFERFEAFAKRLLAVPKQELDEELAKEKRVKLGIAKGSQDEEGTKGSNKV